MTSARLILPALRWSDPSGFSHEAPAIATALHLGVGGFIIFGGRGAGAGEVRALTEHLRSRAGRDLLIASDLERGAGQQVHGLSDFPPPLALASLGPDAIGFAAATTASEARSVGINWVLAPVADLDVLPENPIIQTRAFGGEPQAVAACVRRWVGACRQAGALTCAKHYPGHGRTAADSHDLLPEVAADDRTIWEADGLPFKAAVEAGVDAVMTAHVSYPRIDPHGHPATFSPAILRRLRDELRFDGLVVTDALIMEGALTGDGEGAAAVQAVNAGCDLLLYPKDPTAVSRALDLALANGSLPQARVAEALGRYQRAVALAQSPGKALCQSSFRSPDQLADALLARGMVRGDLPRLAGSIELVVVDDDLGGRWPPGPSHDVARTLAAAGWAAGRGGSRVVLAFAEPRASKGRAGFGAESRRALAAAAPDAALVVLFGHPRLLDQIPGDGPVLLAWHRQRLMQEAVGRWMLNRRP